MNITNDLQAMLPILKGMGRHICVIDTSAEHGEGHIRVVVDQATAIEFYFLNGKLTHMMDLTMSFKDTVDWYSSLICMGTKYKITLE